MRALATSAAPVSPAVAESAAPARSSWAPESAAAVDLRAARVPPGAMHASARSQAALIRQVQRSHGNLAVQRMLRARGGPSVSPVSLASPASPASPALSVLPAPPAAAHAVAKVAAPEAVARPTAQSDAAALQREAAADQPWWKLASFGESVAWRMAGQFAPQIVPLLRSGPAGVVERLQGVAAGAADGVFNGLMNPVRAAAGVGGQLSARFTPLVSSLHDATAKMAANDCSPISQAADKIEQTAQGIVTPLVEKLQPLVAKVQDFLSAAWDKVGAPIFDWIKAYAGEKWDEVKQLASWIWQLGAPMRSLGQDAWTWLKNQLGIGDGPEGENGILQWLQAKFEAGWARIKAQLEPFAKQLAFVKGALTEVAQTFTGPISRIGTLVTQIGGGIGWLAGHLGKGNAIVEARAYVEKSLIPPLADGLRQAGSAVTGVAGSIAGALGKVAGGLDQAAAAISSTVLRFAASAVGWLAGEIGSLSAWANQKLNAVAAALASATVQLERFLNRLAEFLHKLGGVVTDVWRLPAFLAESVWNWIPACIRDPVVDFVVPIILRQIELFQDLARDGDTWQKTKAQVTGIVRRVFVDHDLAGAVKAAFALVLRVLNIPPEMLDKVAGKAAAAWDIVSRSPVEFIKNTVRSLGHGFKLLWNNIGSHLEHGVEGWLFGELADKDIHAPASWSEPKAVFGFVVDVLGLSTGHIIELLKQRIDPRLVAGVQNWVGRFGRAWDWITDAINTSRSPAENSQGLVAQARDFGKSVLTGAAEWIAGKVATELATLAAAAAASGGLSEVIDVARRLYKAMLTAKRWAGRIVQMASDTLDHVLDIAGGNVSKVGAEFEKVMDRGMPVVIGFLADQVGLGGIGAAMRDIVDRLRASVDGAILWLIDKVKGGIGAVAGAVGGAVKAGVAALKGWFATREHFTAADGAHQLYFVGSETAATLVVASVETPVDKLLEANGPLEIEVLASKDATRIQALQAGREALKQLKVAQDAAEKAQKAGTADAASAAALASWIAKLRQALTLTGVATPGSSGTLGFEPIAPGAEITLLGKTSQLPTGTTAIVQSVDLEKGTFSCQVVADTGRKFDLEKRLATFRVDWRVFEPGDELDPQCHHKIPYANTTFPHPLHPLAVMAHANLKTDSRNLVKIRGHKEPHSESYHVGVRQRMDKGFHQLPADVKSFHTNKTAPTKAARAAADQKLGEVMEQITADIKSRSLPLYDYRAVTVTQDRC